MTWSTEYQCLVQSVARQPLPLLRRGGHTCHQQHLGKRESLRGAGTSVPPGTTRQHFWESHHYLPGGCASGVLLPLPEGFSWSRQGLYSGWTLGPKAHCLFILVSGYLGTGGRKEDTSELWLTPGKEEAMDTPQLAAKRQGVTWAPEGNGEAEGLGVQVRHSLLFPTP